MEKHTTGNTYHDCPQNVFSYYRMCSLTTECVLLLQNVFSCYTTGNMSTYRDCPPTRDTCDQRLTVTYDSSYDQLQGLGCMV